MITLTTKWQQVETTLQWLLDRADFTILYFYPKDNTPWCTIEAVDFAKNIKKFDELKTQVIWVSKDNYSSHCKFADKHGLNFDLISDPDFVLHKKFDAVGEKSMYGKKYIWTIRSTFLLNKKWEILKDWRDVSASGHVENILAILDKIINS